MRLDHKSFSAGACSGRPGASPDTEKHARRNAAWSESGKTTVCRIFSCQTLFEIVWDDSTFRHRPFGLRRTSCAKHVADLSTAALRGERRWGPQAASFAGGHRIRVPPVPIPNTEVKPDTADGTARETAWESRSLPALILEARSSTDGRAFVCTPAPTAVHAVSRALRGRCFRQPPRTLGGGVGE